MAAVMGGVGEGEMRGDTSNITSNIKQWERVSLVGGGLTNIIPPMAASKMLALPIPPFPHLQLTRGRIVDKGLQL